jgi:type IX secretion system PorP/SprF family membrane protein
MKRTLLVLAACITGLSVSAQQRPHYTQYVLNNFIINPAVAGIENYWDAKISHRHQWVGLDGAPVTTYFTIHGPLKKSDYDRETATTFHAKGENPRGQAYWDSYTAADPHAGVGFTVLNDKTGPLSRFSATATYAYHLSLSPRTSLSMGVSAGVQSMNLNTSKLDFGPVNVDPAVAGSGELKRLKPDISAGLWLYSRDYFIGLAAQQIVPVKVSYADNTNTVGLENSKMVPHIFLSAGYRMFLTDDLSLLPSALIKYVKPSPVSFDINAKLQYQDFVWVGGSYRNQDGFAAMVGINFSSNINLGYSYDITTSRLNTVSKGTHEIQIGFLLGNKYGDWCPRNLW